MCADALIGHENRAVNPALNGWRFVALLLSLLLVTDAMAAGGPRAVPVVVDLVSERMMAPTVMVAGSVVSRLDAEVAAEMAGRLVWLAEVGDRVAQGDKLAQIDDVSRRLEVDEARAKEAQVKARLTFLDKELKRLRSLAKQNNAARTMLEQTESDRDVARADLAAARARVQLAQDRVARSAPRAPFDGTVVQRLLEPGEWADSGAKVVRLVNTEQVEVRAMVPLSSLRFVSRGARLRVQANGEQQLARVRLLVPVGDLQSRLMDLRLDLDSTQWPAGQSVRIAVPTAQAVKVLTVHRDAVVLRRSGSYLYRVNAENRAERVDVTLGIAMGDYIQVSGALAVGDRVITVGNERLRPGQLVSVKGGARE